MNSPTPAPEWGDVIRSFQHLGPGGDAALAAAHPDLVEAITSIAVGESRDIAGITVTRQEDRHIEGWTGDSRWNVAGHKNLASPWVVVQSLRSALLHGGA